jgi:hypothetical protein
MGDSNRNNLDSTLSRVCVGLVSGGLFGVPCAIAIATPSYHPKVLFCGDKASMLASIWPVLLSYALQPSQLEPMSNATYPTVTAADKQYAEAASSAADKHVSELEVERDQAWQVARSNLAVASSPPIRSSAVLTLLSKETQRFEELERSIREAKAQATHKRRIAELTGGAWDAKESRALKKLRVRQAEAALAAAIDAERKNAAAENEQLHELAVEKNRA